MSRVPHKMHDQFTIIIMGLVVVSTGTLIWAVLSNCLTLTYLLQTFPGSPCEVFF